MASEIQGKDITVSIKMKNMNGKKPFAFVLMPFHPDFDDTYELGIKAACQTVGVRCERVDEQIFTEDILRRVYQQIEDADIIISDMTGKNPNVYYETGYAHAFAKQVILLTQEKSDIPFDLSHYPHIIYERKIVRLKQELEKRIKWCIDHPITSQNTPPRWNDYINQTIKQENMGFYIHYLDSCIHQNKFIDLHIEPNTEISQKNIEQIIDNQPCYLQIDAKGEGDQECLVYDNNKNRIGWLRNPIVYYEKKYYFSVLQIVLDNLELREPASSVPMYKIDKMSFVGLTYSQTEIILRLPVKDIAPWG